MAHPDYMARVKASGHNSISFSQEACGAIADTDGEAWAIADSTKAVWDTREIFTVEASENGVDFNTLSTEEFTLRYLVGRVDLDGYTSGSGVVANVTDVRISGKFFPMYVLAHARSCDYECMRRTANSWVFQMEAEARDYMRLDFNASVEQLALGDVPLDGAADTEKAILDFMLDSEVTVFEISPDTSQGGVVRAFTKVVSNSLSIPNGDLQQGTISFEGDWRGAAMSGQSGAIWDYAA